MSQNENPALLQAGTLSYEKGITSMQSAYGAREKLASRWGVLHKTTESSVKSWYQCYSPKRLV